MKEGPYSKQPAGKNTALVAQEWVGCQQLTAYSFSSSCCPGGPLLPMSRPPLPRLPLPRGSSHVSSLLSSTPSTTALTLTWGTDNNRDEDR